MGSQRYNGSLAVTNAQTIIDTSSHQVVHLHMFGALLARYNGHIETSPRSPFMSIDTSSHQVVHLHMSGAL